MSELGQKRSRTRRSQSGPRGSTTTTGSCRRYSSTMTRRQSYIEHKGKDSGIVRFTFEMFEGLKSVEEEHEDLVQQLEGRGNVATTPGPTQ